MKRWHHFLVLLLLPFFVLGTIGVPVYEHLCSKNGRDVHVFVPITHCASGHQEVLPSCCESKREQCVLPIAAAEDNCCSDKSTWLQLGEFSSEKHTSIVSQCSSILPSPFVEFWAPIVVVAPTSPTTPKEPPLRRYEELIHWHCVYRI